MSKLRAQKGVLFTFLTFLFIGAILGVLLFNTQLNNRTAASTIEISVLTAINSKYDDITDDIIALDHPIGIPGIHQRILPFSFQLDKNIATFNQTIPLASGKLALYFDLINAYGIFVEDQNVSHTFDGVNVDINIPKPPAWGGQNARAGFNLLPQCIQYQVVDTNRIYFQSDNTVGCENTFSMIDAVKRIDLTFSLPTTIDDYNFVSCFFNGTSGCPHEDYNAELFSSLPYIRILFLDANCANCSLTTSDRNISGYFDVDPTNTITFSCQGMDCASQPLEIELDSGLRIAHEGIPVQVSLQVAFTESISTFYYQDANYSVAKPGFDTLKSNVVVFPQ